MNIKKVKNLINCYINNPKISKRLALFMRFKRGSKYIRKNTTKRTLKNFLDGDFERYYFDFKNKYPVGTTFFLRSGFIRISEYDDKSFIINFEKSYTYYMMFKSDNDKETLDLLQMKIWNEFSEEAGYSLIELYKVDCRNVKEFNTTIYFLNYNEGSEFFENLTWEIENCSNISQLDINLSQWLKSLSLEEIRFIGEYSQ